MQRGVASCIQQALSALPGPPHSRSRVPAVMCRDCEELGCPIKACRDFVGCTSCAPGFARFPFAYYWHYRSAPAAVSFLVSCRNCSEAGKAQAQGCVWQGRSTRGSQVPPGVSAGCASDCRSGRRLCSKCKPGYAEVPSYMKLYPGVQGEYCLHGPHLQDCIIAPADQSGV